MFVEQKLNVAAGDVTAPKSSWIAQGVTNPLAQLLVDPLLDGYSKALFRTVQYFRRNQIGDGTSEEVLGFKARHFHGRRNTRYEFDEFVIEQRHTSFQ